MPEKAYQKEKQSVLQTFLKWSPITLVDRMFFTRHLGIMLKGGLSLSLALDTLAKQSEKPRFKAMILDIKRKIEAGISLHKALRRYNKIFGVIYVSMIEVGETSGKMDTVLTTLGEQMEKEHTLRSKITNALMYPAVVTFAMGAIGIAMFLFVVPQVTSLYQDAQVELPFATRLLIIVNEFVLQYLLFLVLGFIALVVFLIRFRSTRAGKLLFSGFVLPIPFMSSIVRKVNLARFSRLLYSLLKTDVPIDRSFLLVAGTLSNIYYRDYLTKVSPRLRAGKSVVQILEKNPHLFPPLVTQMIAVGEGRGTMDDMLLELARFYEEEVSGVLANLASIIEPVLILVLGVVAGGVAVAVVMPIYSLVNQ